MFLEIILDEIRNLSMCVLRANGLSVIILLKFHVILKGISPTSPPVSSSALSTETPLAFPFLLAGFHAHQSVPCNRGV